VRHHLQYLFHYKEADTTLESLVRSQLILASWNAFIINLLPSLHDEHLGRLLQVEGPGNIVAGRSLWRLWLRGRGYVIRARLSNLVGRVWR
jgi:hypothetical protein